MSTSPVPVSWTTAGMSPSPPHLSSSSTLTPLSSPRHLARAQCLDLARPLDGVPPRRPAAAVSVDAPAERHPWLTLGVDRHHDALASEALRGLSDQAGPLERGGIERDLVGARPQEHADVLDAPDAAADGERHVDALGGPANHVEHDGP